VVEEAEEDQYNLVLTHAPDVADELLPYNADLILSGHTHGGQVNLGLFGDYVLPPYGKKYIQGLYSFDTVRNTKLYVNSGIGMTFLPFRFLAPPEITVVTLKKTP
jgi:predicted MPP superfamily phosphohydrolase